MVTAAVDPNVAIIAPLALTFLVTLIAAWVQVHLGKQSHESDARRLKLQFEADKIKLALEQEADRDKWLREQQADAYVSLIECGFEGDRRESVSAQVMARIHAYGSRKVLDALREWAESKEGLGPRWDHLIETINAELHPLVWIGDELDPDKRAVGVAFRIELNRVREEAARALSQVEEARRLEE